MRWFSAQLFEDSKQSEDIYFAPGLGADLSGLAPAYVMTAGFDVLHDEGELYAKKLKAYGVQYNTIVAPICFTVSSHSQARWRKVWMKSIAPPTFSRPHGQVNVSLKQVQVAQLKKYRNRSEP